MVEREDAPGDVNVESRRHCYLLTVYKAARLRIWVSRHGYWVFSCDRSSSGSIAMVAVVEQCWVRLDLRLTRSGQDNPTRMHVHR